MTANYERHESLSSNVGNEQWPKCRVAFGGLESNGKLFSDGGEQRSASKLFGGCGK